MVLDDFLIRSKIRWVITWPRGNKQGIGVGLTIANQIDHSETKYGIGFGLCTPTAFKSNCVIGFTFSSHWSVKMSESLCEFYQFIWLAENGSYPVLVIGSVVALVLVFLQSFEIRSIPCHQRSH